MHFHSRNRKPQLRARCGAFLSRAIRARRQVREAAPRNIRPTVRLVQAAKGGGKFAVPVRRGRWRRRCRRCWQADERRDRNPPRQKRLDQAAIHKDSQVNFSPTSASAIDISSSATISWNQEIGRYGGMLHEPRRVAAVCMAVVDSERQIRSREAHVNTLLRRPATGRHGEQVSVRDHGRRRTSQDTHGYLLSIISHKCINLSNISDILRYLYGRTHM